MFLSLRLLQVITKSNKLEFPLCFFKKCSMQFLFITLNRYIFKDHFNCFCSDTCKIPRGNHGDLQCDDERLC